MIIAVHDANIFIDLIQLDLIGEVLSLEIEVHTTDFVIGELDADQRIIIDRFSKAKKITIPTLEWNEIEMISEISEKWTTLSITDSSVFFLATKLDAVLLTGDNSLRKKAEQAQIKVHGILWLLDELVRTATITNLYAHEKLTRLMQINLRLPREECLKRLSTWEI